MPDENEALASENSEDVKKFARGWADVPFDQMPPGVQRRVQKLIERKRNAERLPQSVSDEVPVPEP